jgi:hypothetical protein
MADKKKVTEKTETVEKVTKTTEPAEPAPTDIDARMAALLKDHQEMGARPK